MYIYSHLFGNLVVLPYLLSKLTNKQQIVKPNKSKTKYLANNLDIIKGVINF